MTTAHPLSVLYADISDSTRLYEQHGDEKARADVAACLEILNVVTGRFSGRLVKTIGDEVMCAFPDPTQAVLAANEMQRAVRDAGRAGRFATGPLHIKVGLHHGPAVEHEGDIFGEAALLAQQSVAQAKADQIVTSRETLESLPVELRGSSRFLDRIESPRIEGREAHLDTIELIWEVSDLTQTMDTEAVAGLRQHTRLVVRHAGRRYELGEERRRLTLGRTEDNEVVVPTRLASRNHAEIEYRRGRFHLRDMSSNGTFLVAADGEVSRMRSESVVLSGRGRICLGGPPDANPEGILDYECE